MLATCDHYSQPTIWQKKMASHWKTTIRLLTLTQPLSPSFFISHFFSLPFLLCLCYVSLCLSLPNSVFPCLHFYFCSFFNLKKNFFFLSFVNPSFSLHQLSDFFFLFISELLFLSVCHCPILILFPDFPFYLFFCHSEEKA